MQILAKSLNSTEGGSDSRILVTIGRLQEWPRSKGTPNAVQEKSVPVNEDQPQFVGITPLHSRIEETMEKKQKRLSGILKLDC